MQLGQLSQQMAVQIGSSEGESGNIRDGQKSETCQNIELRNRVVPENSKIVKQKKDSILTRF